MATLDSRTPTLFPPQVPCSSMRTIKRDIFHRKKSPEANLSRGMWVSFGLKTLLDFDVCSFAFLSCALEKGSWRRPWKWKGRAIDIYVPLGSPLPPVQTLRPLKDFNAAACAGLVLSVFPSPLLVFSQFSLLVWPQR